jgi:beta-lactam-binding protein with PASTA domain
MFRRRRQVTQETVALSPRPRRPLLWPWLLLLTALVVTGIAAAYLLSGDDGSSATKTHVPSVVGLSTEAATEKLAQRGYPVIVRGRVSRGVWLGRVLSQSPSPGTELDRGGQVTIVVARGPSTVDVPNVVGLPVDQAFVRLQSAGLKSRTVKVVSAQPKDRVIRQAPPGGTQARKGSTVVLTASKGPSVATVPALRGLTEASAGATLSRLGFRLSVSRITSTQPKGIVVSQAPPPGTSTPQGSIVAINVSTGGNPAAGGVVVPKVAGLIQAVAVDRIEQAGLGVDSFPVASKLPQGTVVSELPAGGTHVPPRSDVRINVSLGPGPRQKRTVPDVFGRAETDARHALVRAGFTVQTVDQPTSDPGENGGVVKQKPAGGRKAAAGSQIVIYVGRLPAPTG